MKKHWFMAVVVSIVGMYASGLCAEEGLQNPRHQAQHYIDKLNSTKQEQYGPLVNGHILFPTVIQNVDGVVLGLVYSSVESLEEAIAQQKGIYYSRSRGGIWFKSPSGKNSQDLIDVSLNCDGTALLFTVRQRGGFCHEGCLSCFDAAINEDRAVLNPIAPIKIGFCKGRQSEASFSLLHSSGIQVYKNQCPRLTDFVAKSKVYAHIQLLEVRASDVGTLLKEGMLDIALCYDNLLAPQDEQHLVKLGKQSGIHQVQVVVIKKAGQSVPDAPIIFTEYPELTREWAAYHAPQAKIVPVHGGAENLLACGMCDLAVAVKDSGSTIKANKLEVHDILCVSDLYVYVSLGTQEKHPNVVRALKNSLQDKAIYFFSVGDPYGFLSNFYPAPFQSSEGDAIEQWKTVEHYYQAHKFEEHGILYRQIKDAPTALAANKIARKHAQEISPDWHTIKEDVMRQALFYKFSQHLSLKEQLIAIGDRQLVEHAMKDYYWGIGADGTGKNRLGALLMELRTALSK